jgi:tetratricopeptide (TPR) repeat protein
MRGKRFVKRFFLILLSLGVLYSLVLGYRLSTVSHHDGICDVLSCQEKRGLWIDISIKNPKEIFSLQDLKEAEKARKEGHILIERCLQHYPLYPQRLEEWQIKVQWLLQQKQLEAALKVLEEMGQKRPEWKYAGTRLLLENHYVLEACEFTEALLENNPQSAGLWVELARAYALLPHKEKLLSALEKAFTFQEGYKDSVSRLAEFQPYLSDPEFQQILKKK